MKYGLRICAMLFTLLAIGCGIADRTDGSGSQTTNGITVSIAADSITVSAKGEITAYLYSSDYLPMNDSGYHNRKSLSEEECLFSSLSPGRYTLLLRNATGDSSAIIQEIDIASDKRYTLTDTLKQPGALSGALVHNGSKRAGDCIYIKGTPFYTTTLQEGIYDFNMLPEGSYTLSVRFSEEIPSGNSIDYPEKVSVSSNNQELEFNIIIED